MTRTLQAFAAAAVARVRRRRSPRSRRSPEITVRRQRRPAEDAAPTVFVGEVAGVGDELEGPDLRLHAHGPPVRDARRRPHVLARRLAAVPVRSDRQVRARARPGRLRLQRRDRAARRSAGQRLDRRRRREPGREVRCRWAVALVLGRKPETIAVRPGPASGAPLPPARAAAAARRRRRPAGGGGGGRRRRAAGRTSRSRHHRVDVQPSDGRGVGSAGNIYVADGIGNNNRIAKFDKDGNFIKHLGLDRHGARASSTA